MAGHSLKSSTADLPQLSFATRTQLANDLVSELFFLHRQGFVHRDLTPDNVHLDIQKTDTKSAAQKATAKILDFGLSLKFPDNDWKPNDLLIPPKKNVLEVGAHWPPETLDRLQYGPKSDVYSLTGILLVLFNSSPEEEMWYPYMNKTNPSIPREKAVMQSFLFDRIIAFPAITTEDDPRALTIEFLKRMAELDHFARPYAEVPLFFHSLNQLAQLHNAKMQLKTREDISSINEKISDHIKKLKFLLKKSGANLKVKAEEHANIEALNELQAHFTKRNFFLNAHTYLAAKEKLYLLKRKEMAGIATCILALVSVATFATFAEKNWKETARFFSKNISNTSPLPRWSLFIIGIAMYILAAVVAHFYCEKQFKKAYLNGLTQQPRALVLEDTNPLSLR